MQSKCIHYIVSGKVQGVFYRIFVQTHAQALGLTGWVRNLPNGTVELIACGESDKLEELYLHLKEGPELSKVETVTFEEIPWQEHSRFALK